MIRQCFFTYPMDPVVQLAFHATTNFLSLIIPTFLTSANSCLWMNLAIIYAFVILAPAENMTHATVNSALVYVLMHNWSFQRAPLISSSKCTIIAEIHEKPNNNKVLAFRTTSFLSVRFRLWPLNWELANHSGWARKCITTKTILLKIKQYLSSYITTDSLLPDNKADCAAMSVIMSVFHEIRNLLFTYLAYITYMQVEKLARKYKFKYKVEWCMWYIVPIPLTTFRSNSKLDQNVKCSGLKYTLPITTKFYKCHNSVIIVMCEKFHCDRMSTL